MFNPFYSNSPKVFIQQPLFLFQIVNTAVCYKVLTLVIPSKKCKTDKVAKSMILFFFVK